MMGKDLHLYFLGTRDYVNGITILEEMVSAFATEVPGPGTPNGLKMLRLNHFTRTQACLVVTTAKVKPSPECAAVCDIATEDGDVRLLLLPYPDRPVTERREDYDRSLHIGSNESLDEQTRRVHLRAEQGMAGMFQRIRGIVEATYRAELERCRGPRPSLVYLKDFPWLADWDDSCPCLMRRERVLPRAGGNFSIWNLRFGNEPRLAEICYGIDQQP